MYMDIFLKESAMTLVLMRLEGKLEKIIYEKENLIINWNNLNN